LTPAEGRKFGLTVGGAFLVLAAVAYWRGRHATYLTLGSIGGALIAAGLVVPGRLGAIYRAWMGLALAISKITTPIFMGVIYFLIFTPISLVMRMLGKSSLPQPSGSSVWVTRDTSRRRSDLRRQF